MEHSVFFLLVMAILLVQFLICFFVYWDNYSTLAVFHSHALLVDVLVWIGAGATLIIALSYWELIHPLLLWVQIFFSGASLTIHIARFVIGVLRYSSWRDTNQ